MRNIEIKPKILNVKFVVIEPEYSKWTTNSDVLPYFDMVSGTLIVYIKNGSAKISNRYGYSWVHTDFECDNKKCENHNAYGCQNPCEQVIDFSEDRTIAKIKCHIVFNNKYGNHHLQCIYFAVVKYNEHGEPTLYVRRRPAREPFLSMSAQEYKQQYVAKNKHVKNSFCICLYKPPHPNKEYRKLEVA